jgi:hypothetical protein
MSFSFSRDAAGLNTYVIPFNIKPLKYSMQLSQGIEQNFVVPGSSVSYNAIFSYEIGTNVWVACNDTAVAPLGAPSVTSSEPNPIGRLVRAGDTLSFITTSDTADVWVSFNPVN